MNFVDAIRQHYLVHWHDRGFIRTVEPHLFAQFPGVRLVLVAFQIDGGPPGECQHQWKVIDLGDGLDIDQSRTFTGKREIPTHLLSLAQLVYAQSSSLQDRLAEAPDPRAQQGSARGAAEAACSRSKMKDLCPSFR
jgi:hypothetical protein